MTKIARTLVTAETNDVPSPERKAEILAWTNAGRARAGLPALADEWANPPEEEFYRRARALGMARANSRRT